MKPSVLICSSGIWSSLRSTSVNTSTFEEVHTDRTVAHGIRPIFENAFDGIKQMAGSLKTAGAYSSAKRQFRHAGRTQNRNILSFQRLPHMLRQPSPPGRLILPRPSPAFTPSPQARRRSVRSSPRKAAASNGSRPGAARSTGRAQTPTDICPVLRTR